MKIKIARIALAFLLINIVNTPISSASTLNSLVISFSNGTDNTWISKKLVCSPVGGSIKNSKSICGKLIKLSNPFPKANADEVCAELYMGPEKAVVKGIWKGKNVNLTFDKTNSCTNSRWQALSFLFNKSNFN